MNKAPSFQWYPADYLADMQVRMLSWASRGLYVELLCFCWREGYIPADSTAIAQLTGCHDLAIIEPCLLLFSDSGESGKLIHKRLEKERDKQNEHRKERAEAGKKGAESRWGNKKSTRKKKDSKANGSANGSAMMLPMAKNGSSSSISSSTSTSELISTNVDILPFSSPDFLMFWSNWMQHRIEIKKKLTPTTKKQQLAKLGEMGEARAIAALKHSLAGGWQGIFEPQGAAATSTSIPDDEAVLLMGAIDSIRTSWQKIPWNNEDRAALIKYQEQLAALTDDDLQILKAYFESTAEGYFRPDNRSKFCESLSGIWTACDRWKKATGYRAPNSRDSLYYGS